MNEAQKAEYQELKDLEGAGNLEESQKSLLALYKAMEQAEQTAEKKQKDLESALAQKDHFRTKAEKAEGLAAELQAKVDKASGAPTKGLEVEDFIGISASLEGLDQREKEKLAELHKLTGTPLKELKTSEDFLLWQDGYKIKVEKERALKPTSTQTDTDKARKLSEVLLDPKTPPEEREKLLKQAGLYKDSGSPPPTAQRKVLMP